MIFVFYFPFICWYIDTFFWHILTMDWCKKCFPVLRWFWSYCGTFTPCWRLGDDPTPTYNFESCLEVLLPVHPESTRNLPVSRMSTAQPAQPHELPRNQARKPLPTRVPWRFQIGWRPSSEKGWSRLETACLLCLNFCFCHLPVSVPIGWSGHV